jgi:hypothetical protein
VAVNAQAEAAVASYGGTAASSDNDIDGTVCLMPDHGELLHVK